MNQPTLPQQAELCRKHVIDAITAASSGLTLADLQQQDGMLQFKRRMVRNTVTELEGEGALEFEQLHQATKTYFIAGKVPRVRVRRVAAASLPPLQMPKANWLSALGMAA